MILWSKEPPRNKGIWGGFFIGAGHPQNGGRMTSFQLTGQEHIFIFNKIFSATLTKQD
jgi:hypothetical protein